MLFPFLVTGVPENKKNKKIYKTPNPVQDPTYSTFKQTIHLYQQLKAKSYNFNYNTFTCKRCLKKKKSKTCTDYIC